MKNKISIAVILIIIIIVNLMPSMAVHSSANSFNSDKICEAEDGSIKSGVLRVKSQSASGGKYLRSKEVKVTSADAIDQSDFEMVFDAPTTKAYKLYIRAYLPTAADSIFFYRWDDGEWIKYDGGFVSGDFAWIQLADARLIQGKHKLSVCHSGTNTWFDAVYLQNEVEPPKTIDGVIELPNHESNVREYVEKQENVARVTGDGTVFTADIMSYTDEFDTVSDSPITGKYALRALTSQDDIPAAGTPGSIELEFTTDKSAKYIIWARVRTISAYSSYFIAMNNEAYVMSYPENIDSYEWKKLASYELKAGEKNTFRIESRRSNWILDELLITDVNYFTPKGSLRTVEIKDEPLKSSYIKPEVYPPANEHPRLLFRKGDINRLKEQLEDSENSIARELYNKYLKQDSLAASASVNAYNPILCKAYDYAIFGNVSHGKEAIKMLFDSYDKWDVSLDASAARGGGRRVFASALIYDWCYELLDAEQKDLIIKNSIAAAVGMSVSWPPSAQNAYQGHGCEAQILRDLLSFAVAVYDERPDIWEFVGGRFYDEYVPAREWYLSLGIHSQGQNYASYRQIWDYWAYYIITAMGGEEPYNKDDLVQNAYSWYLYLRRPDGQLFPDGDSHISPMKYYTANSSELLLASAISKSPYLKSEYLRTIRSANEQGIIETMDYETFTVAHLIINDTSVKSADRDGLPKSRYLKGGVAIARTGWDEGVDSNDAIAFMKMYEYNFGNHQNKDAGSFQLYYKGPLASKGGQYPTYASDYHAGYTHQTISSNSMLVYDPDEPDFEWAGAVAKNDGGQLEAPGFISVNTKEDYRVCEVLAHEIAPDNTSSYTYMKGDLTSAYSDKVTDYKRSFMFFDFDDSEVPAALIVFDRLTSSNAGFKKTWLLNGQSKPEIKGNRSVWTSNPYSEGAYEYTGKMTVDTLLPASGNAEFKVCGGADEGWAVVDGKNLALTSTDADLSPTNEQNVYRMELSPKKSTETDYFLNVLQVSDTRANAYKNVKLIDTKEYYGAFISGRAAMFSKTGNKIKDAFSVNIGEAGNICYTICDVSEGTWLITDSKGNSKKAVSSKDGGILCFEADGRALEIKPIDKAYEKPDLPPVLTEEKNKIHISYNNNYVYTAVEPKLENGSVLAPLSSLAKMMNLECENNFLETFLYSKERNIKASVRLGANTINTQGGNIEMTNFVYSLNGELMIELRALCEAFGQKVYWDEPTNTAYVYPTKIASENIIIPKSPDYAEIKKVTRDDGDIDGTNVVDHVVDGDLSTFWAGEGSERYVYFEFDKDTIISNAEIIFTPSNGRTPKFEVQTSDDGISYESVYVGKGNPDTDGFNWEVFEFEKTKLIKTKYLRLLMKGSDKSLWSNIKEVRFKIGDEMILWENDASYVKIKNAIPDDGKINWEELPSGMIDSNSRSSWTADSKGRYAILELEAPTAIDSVELIFSESEGKTSYFDIELSLDGKSYFVIYSGESNPKAEKNTWESFEFAKSSRAKYIRFTGRGSDKGESISVKEIRFKKAND